MDLSLKQKEALLKLARDSILTHFEGKLPQMPEDELFRQKRGLFVSLHQGEELRGCIGYIKGYNTIAASVVEMARAAAFDDNRFSPIRREEMPLITIEISLLGDLIPVESHAEIQIGRDGLYLQHPYGSGLLLPQVATDWGWDVPTFLRQICQKAGLPYGILQDEQARLFRFTASVFAENQTF